MANHTLNFPMIGDDSKFYAYTRTCTRPPTPTYMKELSIGVEIGSFEYITSHISSVLEGVNQGIVELNRARAHWK